MGIIGGYISDWRGPDSGAEMEMNFSNGAKRVFGTHLIGFRIVND